MADQGNIKPGSPRAYTQAEIRDNFLRQVWTYIDYWKSVETHQDRMEGLAFSILALLDGSNVDICGFKVIPAPHPDDKAFHQKRSENWYPNDIDIGGSLHEGFHQARPQQEDNHVR